MRLKELPLYSWRAVASIPAFADEGPVTVMDAHCGLCARGAKWIARADRAAEFRIVPMQSELGRALFVHFGLEPDDPASWLFLENGRAYTSLDGMIRAGWRMGGLSRALIILRVMPRALQDWLYGYIARNRYRVMGRADLCNMPDPAVQSRLLQ
ncbi:MAG: DCC1-like thiol-disulfide oxidoreductase family protein [Pseudomonadota bacterium]